MKKLIGILLLVVCLSGCFDYSDGNRSGVVTKFSRKGIFWKTWEGQMNVGGVIADSEGNMVPNVWEFSVDSAAPNADAIVSKLNEAQESGKRVKVTYKQELAVAPWRAATTYLVQDVN